MVKKPAEIETGDAQTIEQPSVKKKAKLKPFNFTSDIDPENGCSVVINAPSREEAHKEFQKKFGKKPSTK